MLSTKIVFCTTFLKVQRVFLENKNRFVLNFAFQISSNILDEPLSNEPVKKKCGFFTKCCLFGTVSGLIIIFALSISGFLAFKIFNETKEDISEMISEIERITFENEKLSKMLDFATATTPTTTTATTTTATTTTATPTTQPTEKLQLFISSEEMNWFEANRVILHFF